MSVKPELKVGQVWVEKKTRKGYVRPRRLRIVHVGQRLLSNQDGNTDITPIMYDLYMGRERYFHGGGERWSPSTRTMSTFGLHKNWKLES